MKHTGLKMNHNVITVNGLEYKAVKSEMSCAKCAFIDINCAEYKYACTEDARDDGMSVIFKRHIKLKSR